MNIHDEMSDNEVLDAAAGALSALPVPEPPEAKAIMARGRTRRRRRLAGIGLVGTAAAAASALGLASVLAGGPAPALAAGTIRTTAFTLVKNGNGTVTLTLTMGQMFNPNALQRALAKDDIPALVKIGTQCLSNPAPVMSPNVLSVEVPGGSPLTGPPGVKVQIPHGAVNVIDPAAIPARTELFFDFLNNNRDIKFHLINIGSYTCVSGS